MTCFTHTYQFCTPIITEVCLKNMFGTAIVLGGSLYRLSHRKHCTSNFVYTKLPPRWKNNMLFIRELHLLQWYIQAIICIYKTEYITSVMTVTFYLPLTFPSNTIFKTVRKANKQINRRQWKKGNYRLHHSIEKRSQNI